MNRNIIVFLVAIIAAFNPMLLIGQTAGNPPIVESIEVEYKGIQNVSKEAVMARVQIRPGMPLNQSLIDRSIRSLSSSKLFETINVNTEQISTDKVKLTFIVEPKHRIEEIRFAGNKMKQFKLLDQIDSKVNGVLDELTVKRDSDSLLTFYKKKGYSDAEIEYEITRNDDAGLGIITFYITEGTRLKIKNIKFIGNENIKTRKLLKKIETKEWGMLSWATGSGRFNETAFQEDLDTLRDFYKDEGYLDVQLNESDVEIVSSGKKINITISVTEGRQYHVGDIRISGNTLFSSEELLGALKLTSGEVFSPSLLDEDSGNLRDYYGRLGYLDTGVRAERKPNLQTRNIDIVYTITEGKKNHVESVEIIGNDKTKSIVILRELALAPGDVFDTVKMKNSEARLRNTRYFESVELSPESTNIPGRKDLKVSVKEGRTGNLSFGAGFSSLEKGLVFVELTQGNFDLFNPGSFFQGDGQKFRIRLQLGSTSNQIVLAFEEPWLYEKRLAFGFEIFRTKTDYVSSVYNELRTGFEVYLRKQLVGLWEGRLSYRLELVDIFDVDEQEAALVIINDEGERTVSKVGLSFLRDTRDNLMFTTRGNRMEFITEFAGLGGDTDYIKLEARGAQFFPLFGEDTHVVSVLGRAGTLIENGSGDIPFFDKFYLGGPRTLRGFDYREVGPQAQAADGSFEPVGGNSYGFVSFEYAYKLAEPLRLALFYDGGFVNDSETDFSPSDYNDNWGVGIRILVLGAPLSLDYGIPISSSDENDGDGNQFNFSFGTRF